MSKKLSYNNEALQGSTNIVVVVLVVLSLTAAVILPKLLLRSWGFNQVNYLPEILYYAWIVLGFGIAVLLFISPQKHYISDLLRNYFWGDKKLIGRIATIVLTLTIFVIFRFEAHYYGEGFIHISNLAQQSKTIIEWHNFGGTAIPYLFYIILHAFGMAKLVAAQWAYQGLTFASGIILIYCSFKIAELISDDDNDRISVLFLLLFSGISLFFFGLIETAPMLIALISLFVHWMLLLTRSENQKYLYYLWGIFLFGLFVNIQFITIFPVVIYLTFKTIIGRKQIAGFVGTLAAFIIIICALPIVYMVSIGNLRFENLLLFLSDKSPEVNYALFSGKHLIDLLNLFFMIIPAFTILLFFISRSFKVLRYHQNFAALGLLTLSQFLFLFIIDPKNGMARDLDNYIFLLTGLLFWGLYALIKNREHLGLSRDILMTLCPFSLLLILPMFYVHLTPSVSDQYLDDYLAYNETKYEPAIYAMRDYYNMIGDAEKSTQVERTLNSKAPGALESQLINDLYTHGRVNEAFEYALTLTERNPYNAVYHMQKGNLLKHYRRYSSAEEELKTAIELEPYHPEFYHFLSELYRETKQKSKCYDVLQKGLSFAPMDKTLITDYTGYYYRAGKYKKVDSLTEILASIDLNEPYIYMFKGLVAESRGQKEAAMKLYERFVQLNEKLPEVSIIRKRINSLYLELNPSTPPDSGSAEE